MSSREQNGAAVRPTAMICMAVMLLVAACAPMGTPQGLGPTGTPSPFPGTLVPTAVPTAPFTKTVMAPPPATLPPATLPLATVPPAPPVEVESSALGAAPRTWEALEPWLAQAWTQRRDPAEVRAALRDAGWQRAGAEIVLGDWMGLELTGDLRDEWVLHLRDVEAAAGEADAPQPLFGTFGNLWVIGEGGAVYRHHEGTDLLSREPGVMPELVATADMDADGLPELVIKDTECGAHTCYGYYQVIGLTPSGFANLVDAAGDMDDVIVLSYSDARVVPGEDGDVLYIHGGDIGSAGAGLVRAYTEAWAWDNAPGGAGAVRLRETILDPTPYRHHVLYEAMDAMEAGFRAAGDLARAEELLLAVLEDPTLEVVPFDEPAPGQTEASIAQFAGFRLTLAHLLRGNTAAAGRRVAWLEEVHAGAPLTVAAGRLLAGWSDAEGMPALCARLQEDLEAYEAPTGPLEYMGYGNPSITAAQLCTWGE